MVVVVLDIAGVKGIFILGAVAPRSTASGGIDCYFSLQEQFATSGFGIGESFVC